MHRHLRITIPLALAIACSKDKVGPVLTSLTPATGTVGTVVTIAGTGFVQTPKVTFVPVAGGAAADGTVQSFSATSLDVKVPDAGAKNADGAVFDVKVTNPDGGATTLPKAFKMTSPTETELKGGCTCI